MVLTERRYGTKKEVIRRSSQKIKREILIKMPNLNQAQIADRNDHTSQNIKRSAPPNRRYRPSVALGVHLSIETMQNKMVRKIFFFY